MRTDVIFAGRCILEMNRGSMAITIFIVRMLVTGYVVFFKFLC